MRFVAIAIVVASAIPLLAQDGPRDRRLEKPKDYNGYFPWTPPTDKTAWDKRRQVVREQVLVSQGLWPMPTKTPLNAVIHGKIERDGYTIEKVYFQSLPGHYVTGNLYRPTGKTGKLPAVLNPHGHWPNGRFYEAKDVERQMKTGAEKTRESATYPHQARCAGLARLGCVAFFYDMIGYADSQAIKHREGFRDADAELWLTSFMGLQTWNSIRALDFLLSLPDVDPARVAVTGASGGGTQTFMLCAVDDRPAVGFPAVMVSTAMQGGCICENCSYLRVGTGNIELAGLWAPRPLGMVAADDWTKEIESKGLPELKSLYKLYGCEDNVMAKYFPFPHNYNQVSRELMYHFINKHLKLGHAEPITEKPFVPVPTKELTVFGETHPVPKDAIDAASVRTWWKAEAKKHLAEITRPEGYQKFLQTVEPALRSMVTDALPDPKEVVEVVESKGRRKDKLIYRDYVLSRKGQGEAVRGIGMCTANFAGHVVIWVHPDGLDSLWKDGELVPAAQKIIDADAAILAVEPFRTGKSADAKTYPVNTNFAGYTFGYNRPLLAERVHDILTAIALAKGHSSTRTISVVGFEKAGPWALLARGLCADVVGKAAVDLNGFRFENVMSMDDEMMLPGALRYGGLPVLARLSAQYPLLLHNTKGTGCENLPAAAGVVRTEAGRLDPERVIEWILQK